MPAASKEHLNARATAAIPILRQPYIDSSAAILYILHIVTETRTVDRSDRPRTSMAKSLFPNTASKVVHSQGDQARFVRSEKASEFGWSVADNAESSLFSAARAVYAQPLNVMEDVHTVIAEPECNPQDREDRGVWRRSVEFSFTLTFPFAPTWSIETISWTVWRLQQNSFNAVDATLPVLFQYTLKLTNSFPEFGNDFAWRLLLHAIARLSS
ncbi:hypothetical protein R3P38DRAFT_3176804 [Favolaschia claudopus]|uniref:Uncharacterized protein n=1 Tax=Favolaschia claudopus TaxID=2862362 RepID=A0AAW0D173_9AGAR